MLDLIDERVGSGNDSCRLVLRYARSGAIIAGEPFIRDIEETTMRLWRNESGFGKVLAEGRVHRRVTRPASPSYGDSLPVHVH